MKLFEAPSTFHELASQPIKQLRISRRLDASSEVLRRGDQALAEVSLPNAVDDNAGCGWIARVHDPFCQAEAVQGRTFGERIEYVRNARLNHLAGPEPVTAFEKMSNSRVRPLMQHERGWRFRPIGPDVFDLLI